MRIYETTFILSPQADDAAFDRQIKSVTDLITRYEGKVLAEDRWGVRRLSYPIKKFTQGYYTRLVYEGNGAVLTELDRFFRIEESYIRYLTVVFEGQLEMRPPVTADVGLHSVAQSAPLPPHIPAVEPIADAVDLAANGEKSGDPYWDDDKGNKEKDNEL